MNLNEQMNRKSKLKHGEPISCVQTLGFYMILPVSIYKSLFDQTESIINFGLAQIGGCPKIAIKNNRKTADKLWDGLGYQF